MKLSASTLQLLVHQHYVNRKVGVVYRTLCSLAEFTQPYGLSALLRRCFCRLAG